MEQEVDDFVVSGNTVDVDPAVVAAAVPAAVESTDLDDLPTPDPASAAATKADADAKAERDEAGRFAKGKPRNDVQARIDQLTAQKYEAERRAADAESRLNATTKPAEAPKPVVATADDPEPQIENYDDYRQYVKAQARWEIRQELQEREQAQRDKANADQERATEAAREAAYERHRGTFAERLKAEVENLDEFFSTEVDPRLYNAKPLSAMTKAEQKNATFGNFLADQVLKSSHPKALLLHMSKPDTVQRLATLQREEGTEAVLSELAMFHVRLGAASQPTGPARAASISKAATPIKPVRGSSHVADEAPDPDDLDLDKHASYWNRKEREGRSR